MRKTLIYTLILSALILAGCIQTSSEPEIETTQLLPSPQPIIPPEIFDFQNGAALFTSSCAPCHGQTGQGDGPAATGFSCEMPKLALRGEDATIANWYSTVTNGKRESDTCIMPPWNQRLNAGQIWDVAAYAYNMVYQGQATEGEALLKARQTGDLSPDLTSSDWQVNISDQALREQIESNTLQGLDFSQAPTDQEKLALIAYIRSLIFIGATEIAAVPNPQSTEEPGATPQPNATEEPSASTTTTSTLTITGVMANGTAGGTVPPNLPLTVRVVAIGADGQPTEIYNAQTTADAENRFTFTDLPRDPRSLAIIHTEYAGIRQFSEQIFPGSITEDTYDLTFYIYETTTDSSAIAISYVEMLVDAVTEEGASLTYQSYEFTNNGDRAYIGDDQGRTLKIIMPKGAVSSQISVFGGSPDRFQLVREGSDSIFYDSSPVFPGPVERIVTSYNFVYNSSMTIQQTFAYPVEDLGVYTSTQHNLLTESSQLQPVESAEVNGILYSGFTLNVDTLAAGDTFSYRVYDDPNAPRSSTAASSSEKGDSASFLRENSNLILGIGVLLLVAGGMFLFYDLQKTRILAQTQANQRGNGRKNKNNGNGLPEQIAELDAAYEAGEIDELAYHKQREALKEKLRQQMS